MSMLPILFSLVFVAGFATQRGSVCAVGAVQEVIEDRRASRLLGFLFCAACAFAVMAIMQWSGTPVLALHRDLPIRPTTVIGGMVFALGAHINGKCAFGTVGALGGGNLAYGATLAGFLAGAFTLFASGTVRASALNGVVLSPLLQFDAAILVAVSLGLALVLALAMRRQGGFRATTSGWSQVRAMAVIGIVNATLLTLAHDWPYTRLLVDIAAMEGNHIPHRIVLTFAFVLGAVGGAVAGRSFKVQHGTRSQWLRASLGGFVMGMGAVLIPGGNDMMLMVGLPLLLPNLAVAYIVTMATLWALETIAARWRAAPIRWPLRKDRA